MKHILNNISQEEKQRILEQHSGGKTIDTSSFKRLLESKLGDVKPLIMEEVTGKTQSTSGTTGGGGAPAVGAAERTVIDEPTFPINEYYDAKGVIVNFNPATGRGGFQGHYHGGVNPSRNLSYAITCKCDTGDGTGIYSSEFKKNADSVEPPKTLNIPNLDKYFKEKCKTYLQDKKCAPILATRGELDALYQRVANGDLQEGDKNTICKFINARQHYDGQWNSDKNKIMEKVLSDFKFYGPSANQKEVDSYTSQDFRDKGDLYCKSWGLSNPTKK